MKKSVALIRIYSYLAFWRAGISGNAFVQVQRSLSILITLLFHKQARGRVGAAQRWTLRFMREETLRLVDSRWHWHIKVWHVVLNGAPPTVRGRASW